MLTRSEVARRLNRSIATVRRLENVVLHPTRGRNNVRLFDPWEVDLVARDPSRMAPFCRSSWFETNRGNWAKPRMRSGGKTFQKQRPETEEPASGCRRRLAVADELEATIEVLLDAPPRRLMAAGIDDRALEVLVAAVDLLRSA
jgi:hypothetical protein